MILPWLHFCHQIIMAGRCSHQTNTQLVPLFHSISLLFHSMHQEYFQYPPRSSITIHHKHTHPLCRQRRSRVPPVMSLRRRLCQSDALPVQIVRFFDVTELSATSWSQAMIVITVNQVVITQTAFDNTSLLWKKCEYVLQQFQQDFPAKSVGLFPPNPSLEIVVILVGLKYLKFKVCMESMLWKQCEYVLNNTQTNGMIWNKSVSRRNKRTYTFVIQ